MIIIAQNPDTLFISLRYHLRNHNLVVVLVSAAKDLLADLPHYLLDVLADGAEDHRLLRAFSLLILLLGSTE